MFINYGLDEFGYKFYDLVIKNLVRSRGAMFMEDQSIHDIGKTKLTEQYRDDLLESDLDRTPGMTLDHRRELQGDIDGR